MEEHERRAPDKGRILVVDDEAPVVELLGQWLAAEGYQVRPALDFDEVQCAMGEEMFDLVTLDIMMPEVDGLQTLQWIRARYPDVGVIMATALGDLGHVIEAMRAGAINYLTKPFNLELVTEQIHRGMERQELIAENRAYQRDLEQKVEDRTRQLQEAHAQLEHTVRELEGRDRLVQVQMSPPASFRQADEEILGIVAGVLGASQATIWRPEVGGEYLEARVALGLAAPGQLADESQLSALPAVPVYAEEALVAQVFREGQARAGASGEVITPILYNTEVLGVLQAAGVPDPDQRAALYTLRNLGREIALVWRILQMAEDLEAGHGEMDELLHLEVQSPTDSLEWEE